MQTGLCFQLNSFCLPLILFIVCLCTSTRRNLVAVFLLLLYFHLPLHLFRLLSIHGIVFPYLSFDAMRRSFQLVFRITAWASCLDTFTRSLCHLKGDAKAHFISFYLCFLYPSLLLLRSIASEHTLLSGPCLLIQSRKSSVWHRWFWI